MNDRWTRTELESRIDGTGERRRFAAGSPDRAEVAAYGRAIPEHAKLGLVLGMTPELRNLLAPRCGRLVSVDRNPSAISLYGEWLDPGFRDREQVIVTDWLDLQDHLPGQAEVIVGDGVFGNIVPMAGYFALLEVCAKLLGSGGVLVTRQCLMPDGTPESPITRRDQLLAAYREGAIDESEFGFTMRMQGYYDEAYDPGTAILDNAITFQLLNRDAARGLISPAELDLVRRYSFSSTNTLPTRSKWEAILSHAGYSFDREVCTGKNWYDWYSIYACRID